MKKTKVQKLSSLIEARRYCDNTGNIEWFIRHDDEIEKIIDDLPSGIVTNEGNVIDYGKTTTEKIVINSTYRVMNDQDNHDGLIDYTVVITPSFQDGFNVSIYGNFSSFKYFIDIKDCLTKLYRNSLMEG